MLRTTSPRQERGAALVEFAIVLPLLVMLMLGIFTGGLAYNRKIGISNAVREGSRYGATLPVASAPACASAAPMECWLAAVASLTEQASEANLTSTVAARSICVAYVYPIGNDATTPNDSSRRLVRTTGDVYTIGGTCFDDGRAATERRVQVVASRPGQIQYLVGHCQSEPAEPGRDALRGCMRRRSVRDERGAVLPIAAGAMVALLVTAALVVDLGATRALRRDARATADAAAAAGAIDVAQPTATTACETAFGYAFANMPGASPSLTQVTAACAAANMQAACPSARREAVLTIADKTVRVVNPVFDGDRLMRGTAVGGGSTQIVSPSADGEACLRIGVQITRLQARFFGGVVTRSRDTFSVHSVARYNPAGLSRGFAPALVALNKTACDAVSAGNNGEINIRSLNELPASAYSDSDGTACTPGQSIMTAFNSGHLRAVENGGLAGELAWFGSSTSGSRGGSSKVTSGDVSNPANYVGRLFGREKRVTREPADQRYHCRNVPPTTQPLCASSNDAVAVGLSYLAPGSPVDPSTGAGYQTYTGSCSPNSDPNFAVGNWYVDCPTFLVKGTRVTFRGGNVVFSGNLSIASRGEMLVNSPPVPSSIPSPPVPLAPVSPSIQSMLVVRGVIEVSSNGKSSWSQTTAIGGGNLNLQAGATMLWGPPSGPDPTTVPSSRRGLLYWSEAPATINLQGGPTLGAAGVFFAGNAGLTAAGNGEIDLSRVQLWADTVRVSTGGPKLKMAADPEYMVSLGKPGTRLIR